jgi:hypothetical protein
MRYRIGAQLKPVPSTTRRRGSPHEEIAEPSKSLPSIQRTRLDQPVPHLDGVGGQLVKPFGMGWFRQPGIRYQIEQLGDVVCTTKGYTRSREDGFQSLLNRLLGVKPNQRVAYLNVIRQLSECQGILSSQIQKDIGKETLSHVRCDPP